MNTTTMTKMHHKLVAVTERAEAAEAELLAVREDNHSMMLEIDGLRTERDRLAAELANLLAYPNVLRLTGEMIAELCGFAGFSFDREELDESLAEDEFTIHHCPTIGVREDDGSIGHYQYVVIAENGDDGEVFPLGPKLPAPVAAPAVPALSVPDGDDFNGTTPHLIQCMEALVRLDADGVLVPHGIGRSASRLLSTAANRLRKQTAPSVPEEWLEAAQRLIDAAGDKTCSSLRCNYPMDCCSRELIGAMDAMSAMLQSAPQSEVRHD